MRTATVHNWIQTGLFVLGVVIAIVSATAYITTSITRVETKVDTIMENDLPHIDERLTRLEKHFGIEGAD